MNGKEFNDVYLANRLNKWIGLKVAISNGKFTSIIANFVYVMYMTDNISYSTGSGEKIIDQGTSQTVSPAAKLSRAWNEMSYQLNTLLHFMASDRTTYAAFSSVSLDRNLLRRMNAFGIYERTRIHIDRCT
jgi:hypothetical protein